MSSVAVLQARTDSSRLPAKVLLPVNEIPVAVLAAKRAGNTGRKVIVATSEASTDDILADNVSKWGIPLYRGSLADPLERIVNALTGYEDQTIVFRLTGDNVFPDGCLLDEMEKVFVDEGHDYLCCMGEKSGLPYGMSAEVTRLKHLREAAKNAADQASRENVTPYVIGQFGRRFFTKYQSLQKHAHRCTIDNLDDYLTVCRVFKGIADPVEVPAFDLVDRLAALDRAVVTTQPLRNMVIGGAQLGMHYGITNQAGQPDQKESERIIRTAISNGVEYIDTARAYGQSEASIGSALRSGWHARARVVTKLSPLADCPADADEATVNAFVEASIYHSCRALGLPGLHAVLLHRTDHMDAWQGAAWKALLKLHNNGVIEKLGASVQTPQELKRALAQPLVQLIQMPYNILDTRWREPIEYLQQAKQEREVTVHVRSVFLQGLLLTDDPKHWQRAHCSQPEKIRKWLEKHARAWQRRDIKDLCLAYVRSLPWVDGIVVGMETLDQLQEIIRLFNRPALEPEALRQIEGDRPGVSENLLNPANWD